MDCRPPRRLYITFADVMEGKMEIDFEPEDDTVDGLVDTDVAYGMGISAVDFFMGALHRLGDDGSDLAAQFTKAFVRELVHSQLVITTETVDDNPDESPP